MRGPKVSVNEIWSMKEWTWECSLSLGQVISSCCCFQMFMGSLSCACVLTTGLLKHTTASLASLCPFPCTVLFCGPCLPILKVQYLISLFSKSLQVWKTQNFVKVFFFFSLRLFYYLSNLWVRQTSWSSICYHSNHTPGNKSSSQLFCIFFYVSYDGVC